MTIALSPASTRSIKTMAIRADHQAAEKNSIAKPLCVVSVNTDLAMRLGGLEPRPARCTNKCMAKVLLDEQRQLRQRPNTNAASSGEPGRRGACRIDDSPTGNYSPSAAIRPLNRFA